MFLFMLVLLPAVLFYCCLRSTDKSVISVAMTGAVSGVFVSACTALFTYLHRIPELSFAGNTFYYFFKEYFIPVILLYAVYSLVISDEKEYKVKTFFPLMLAFYAVYMPYRVIASNSGAFSLFSIFVKPVLVLCMLIYLAKFNFVFYKANLGKNSKYQVAAVLLALVAMLIPACLEGMYTVFFAVPLVYVVSLLYAGFSVFVFLRQVREEDSFLL